MKPAYPVPPMNRALRLARGIARPALMRLTTRTWTGAEHLPRDRGFVAVPNHSSYIDPLVVAHFLVDNGVAPYFLAKESLFRVPVVGRLIGASGQIPVYRGSQRAADAYQAALDAIDEGRCVIIYPEGTLTRDPQRWPMVGKTGAARVALASDCPVVPIAHWGDQEMMARGDRLPKTWHADVSVTAGPPVDLQDLRSGPFDVRTLREATRRIMADITTLEAGLRGETPPAQPFDPRRDGPAAPGAVRPDTDGTE